MNSERKIEQSAKNEGFTGSASGATALVQVSIAPVQNRGAKNDGGIAPICTSVLNVEVSCFPNYWTPDSPQSVNLLTWLTSDKYANQIEAIRQADNKAHRDRLKAELPAITPSGVFRQRNIQGLIKHSGFLQFDVDNVTDIEAIKIKITSLVNVAYCGSSASGRGLWGLIPIVEPEHHTEYFTFIQKAFAGRGITIDPACKDVCRLRGYSYDPDAYFNHAAKPLAKWYKPQKNTPISHFMPVCSGGNIYKVEECLNGIEAKGIDLTGSYEQWFKLGCALANEFEEGGRMYFHSVSQFHPDYKPENTDRQFTYCLKHRYSTTIASFFAACRDAGITYKQVQKKIAPVQNGGFEGIDNQSLSGAKNGGGIEIAPVAPVGDFTHLEAIQAPINGGVANDKWRRLNRLLNKGARACKQYGDGQITVQQWDAVQDEIIAELSERGIPLDDYVKAANFIKNTR